MKNEFDDTFLGENVQLEFCNFKPDLRDKRSVRGLLNRIEESSPSNAFIKVLFKKDEEVFSGNIEIFSQKKNFNEQASNENMSSLIEELFKCLNTQIDEWKKFRFSKIDEVSI